MNADKTKCMVMSRYQNGGRSHNIKDESSGYPFTSKTNKNMKQIKDSIHENRHPTVCNLVSEPDYHL